MGFFNGVEINNICGCGAYIVIKSGYYYHFRWSGGLGSNSRAKIMALWGVIYCVKCLSTEIVDIYRYSKGVI